MQLKQKKGIDMQLLYVSLFCLWLFSYLFFRYILTRWYSINGVKRADMAPLPPSPMSLPIVGHLYLLGPLLHQSLHALAMRYGPLIHLNLGSLGSSVVVSSPAMAKEFLKSHDLTFASRPRLVGQEYLGEDSVAFTFLPYGPCWKFVKKVFVTELFSTRKVEQTARIRREEIRRFLESLLDKSRSGEKADLEEMLGSLSNNIICRMTMSIRSMGGENEADEFRKVVREMIELAGKLNIVHLLMGRIGKLDLFGYGKRLRDANQRYLVMVEKIMKEHEQKKKLKQVQKTKKEEDGEEDEEDLMDAMLKISEDDNAEFKLMRYNIKTFLLDIFAAGTETSSLTMQWALAELIRHPTLLEKAREEIESVVGKKRLVDESDIPKLPYIQAVIKETLRIHPPGPLVLRECGQDCTIEGFYIPKKTTLFINCWSLGRDPEYWENPLEFRPERFLNSDGATQTQNTIAVDVKGHHFQLLPFGSGRRTCPGLPLALPVMQATVAAMVQCFDWKMSNGPDQSMTGINMKEKAGFTLRMEEPLHCIPVAHCTTSLAN